MRTPDPKRRVIAILRPAPEGAATAAALRRGGIAAVAAPVVRIRFTGRAGALNPRRFPGLTLFTSPRGVAATQRRLSPPARVRLRRLRPAAAVVGPATAAAARQAGYCVIAGHKANGATELQRELARSRYLQRLEKGAEILVVSPERDNPLAEFLRSQCVRPGAVWRITRRADYTAAKHAPGIRRVIALLQRRSLAGLIAGSPRQAEFLWRGAPPRHRPTLAAILCIAPGATTATTLHRLGFKRIMVVPALRIATCRKALSLPAPRDSAARRPIK